MKDETIDSLIEIWILFVVILYLIDSFRDTIRYMLLNDYLPMLLNFVLYLLYN